MRETRETENPMPGKTQIVRKEIARSEIAHRETVDRTIADKTVIVRIADRGTMRREVAIQDEAITGREMPVDKTHDRQPRHRAHDPRQKAMYREKATLQKAKLPHATRPQRTFKKNLREASESDSAAS